MLTDAHLHAVMPTLDPARRAASLGPLNEAMRRFGIGRSARRVAAFLAQVAFESDELRALEERWIPTPQQQRCEPPSDLAKRLGNTEPGDGERFRGRGAIAIAGRFNYDKFGRLLGLDLLGDPQRAAAPDAAFAVAALYWQSNGFNELADAQEFVTITRRINGGTEGYAQRQRYLALAREALAEGFVPDADAPDAAPRGNIALARGHELIVRSARAAKGAATRAARKRR